MSDKKPSKSDIFDKKAPKPGTTDKDFPKPGTSDKKPDTDVNPFSHAFKMLDAKSVEPGVFDKAPNTHTTLPIDDIKDRVDVWVDKLIEVLKIEKEQPKRKLELSPFLKKLDEDPDYDLYEEASLARKATINELLVKLGEEPVDFGIPDKKPNADTATNKKTTERDIGKAPDEVFKKSGEKSSEPTIFEKLSRNSIKDRKINNGNDESTHTIERLMAEFEDWCEDQMAHEAELEKLFIEGLRLREQGRELLKPRERSIYWDMICKPNRKDEDHSMSNDPPRSVHLDVTRKILEMLINAIKEHILNSDKEFLETLKWAMEGKEAKMKETADLAEMCRESLSGIIDVQAMMDPTTREKFEGFNAYVFRMVDLMTRLSENVTKEEERLNATLDEAKDAFEASETKFRVIIEEVKKLVKDAGMDPSLAGELEELVDAEIWDKRLQTMFRTLLTEPKDLASTQLDLAKLNLTRPGEDQEG